MDDSTRYQINCIEHKIDRLAENVYRRHDELLQLKERVKILTACVMVILANAIGWIIWMWS